MAILRWSFKELSSYFSAFEAIALRIAYGIDLAEDDGTCLRIFHTMMDIAKDIVVPGRYLVEMFPALQHIPTCLPGAGFKRRAEKIKEEEKQYLQYLYETGKRTVSSLQRWLPVVRTDST